MVDALVSGTSVRDDVQVRVLSWALNQEAGFKTENQAFFCGGWPAAGAAAATAGRGRRLAVSV